MKKSVVEGYRDVPESQISALAQAIAPESANRLPEQIVGFLPRMKFIPKTDTMPEWQAIIALDNQGNAYPISPRVLKGYAWISKKLVKYDAENCVAVSAIDFAKANTAVTVTYNDHEVDDFGKPDLITRALPHFRLAVAKAEIVGEKKSTRKNNK